MYNLSQDQISEFQNFLNKLEDSMVRSHLQKWFNEVQPTERVTGEQFEKLLSFQNALPKEVQSFPQSFAQWLKNREHTERTESKADVHTVADLGADVASSIEDLDDKSSPENVEETLHDLGNVKGKKAGVKKATSKAATPKDKKKKK